MHPAIAATDVKHTVGAQPYTQQAVASTAGSVFPSPPVLVRQNAFGFPIAPPVTAQASGIVTTTGPVASTVVSPATQAPQSVVNSVTPSAGTQVPTSDPQLAELLALKQLKQYLQQLPTSGAVSNPQPVQPPKASSTTSYTVPASCLPWPSGTATPAAALSAGVLRRAAKRTAAGAFGRSAAMDDGPDDSHAGAGRSDDPDDSEEDDARSEAGAAEEDDDFDMLVATVARIDQKCDALAGGLSLVLKLLNALTPKSATSSPAANTTVIS